MKGESSVMPSLWLSTLQVEVLLCEGGGEIRGVLGPKCMLGRVDGPIPRLPRSEDRKASLALTVGFANASTENASANNPVDLANIVVF